MKRFVMLRPSHLAAAIALACATPSLCHAQQPADAPSADDNTRVRALFRKGVAAFTSGKNDEAAKILREAWSIRKTYDVAAALAQAELSLKDYREAAEHLDFCLSHFAPIESEQTLQQIKGAFADVKTHVAALKITVDHEGAEVHVDDRNLGASPLEASAFVDPGVHTLVARLGGDQVTQTVQADAGKEYPVTMKFGAAKAVQAGARVTPPGSQAANTTDGERSTVPVIVGGAVFVVGVASAIGFKVAAGSEGDKVSTFAEKNGLSGCGNGTALATDCAAQHDAAKSKDRDNNLALVSVLVAGTAAIAVPVYWFWPRQSAANASARKSQLLVGGAPNPHGDGGSVWLSGNF